jgi:hypothetical protein
MGLTRSSLSSRPAVREHAPLLLAALLSAVLAGCGEENREPPPSRSSLSTAPEFTQIEFEAQLPQSPFAAEITSVHVQIAGPPQAATTVPLSRQGETWKGHVRVPTTEEGYYFVGRAISGSNQFLFESILDVPPAGPDGTLSVVLPFSLRTPLPFVQLEFQAQFPPGERVSEVAYVQVQIAGPPQAATTVSLSRQGETWKGSVRVPPVEGSYALVGRAFSTSGQFLFQSVVSAPAEAPEGTLSVVLPFSLRTP